MAFDLNKQFTFWLNVISFTRALEDAFQHQECSIDLVDYTPFDKQSLVDHCYIAHNYS